jgi:antagonist of KipI
MDLDAHRAANQLVGNDVSAATLEATIVGPELRVEAATVVAVAGADLEPSVDGMRVPWDAPVKCRAGSVLRFGRRRAGGRAYVAFRGGIDVPPVLGSRATHLRTGMGGFEGRAVRAGDRLPLGTPTEVPSRTIAPLRHSAGGARLRVLRGPQEDVFPSAAYDVLTSTRFVIAPDSDRMGFRLTTHRTLARLTEREMISGATFAGAIQVPASGQPILLMADRPTTGGYPQIAVVIAADLPLAGQLLPGDVVEFELCSIGEAMTALRERRHAGGAPGVRA